MNTLVNSVTLIGNLGSDISIQELSNGSKVGKVNVATSSYYKDAKGETVQKTQWHPIVAWNKTADNMSQILRKGSKVAVRGELNHDTYKDKDGNTKYFTSVKVLEFQKLTPKDEKLPF